MLPSPAALAQRSILANTPQRACTGCKFTVSGSVVDSVTGQPIPRALVQALIGGGAAGFTDNEGQFRIEGIPQMQAEITARKPGYFTEREINPRRFVSHPVRVDADINGLVLKLIPGGSIAGHVQDASGEPIEGAQVTVFLARDAESRKGWETRTTATTNEDGEFRAGGLPPGAYYLSATVTGSDSATVRTATGQTLGYPSLVYYPSGRDRSAASPIQVGPGERAPADFSLRREPVFRVSGFYSGGPSQPISIALRDASGDTPPFPARIDPRSGAFELWRVPAGAYTINATSWDSQGASYLAEAPLAVSGNVTGVQLVLAPLISIPVAVQTQEVRPERVENQGASPPAPSRGSPPPVSLRVIPVDHDCCENWAQTEGVPDHPSLVLRNVRPGKYRVSVNASAPWYVESAQYGSQNVLREPIDVSGPQPLNVTLRDDGATLGVKVRGLPPNGAASVIAVCESAPMLSPKIIFAGAGYEALDSTMPPGDYALFAYSPRDRIDYTDPKAIKPFLAKATHVTLSPNSKTSVTLDVVKSEE